jgi:hypothetical protein
MAALSQLSYSPVEVEVVRKGNACLLPVASGGESQPYSVPPCPDGCEEQEASIQLSAVDAEQVDFFLGVLRADIAVRRAARSADSHDYHVAVGAQLSPLALDAEQPLADVQHEVSAFVLAGGRPNWDL